MGQYLLNAFCEPDIILNTICMLSHLLFTIDSDEGIEVKKVLSTYPGSQLW